MWGGAWGTTQRRSGRRQSLFQAWFDPQGDSGLGRRGAQEDSGCGTDRSGPGPDLRRRCLSFSPQCRAAASTAFAEVERRLRAGGAARAALRAELGACASLGRAEDQAELLGALQAVVGGAVQYDGQAGTPLNVRQLCGLLQGGGNGSRLMPYGGLRQAVQVSSPELAGGPADKTTAPPPLCDLGQPKPFLSFSFLSVK